MTDEEILAMLQASSAPAAPSGDTTDEQLAAALGLDLTAAEPPPEPTLGQRAAHIGKGVGRAALDFANLPYYANQGLEWLEENVAGGADVRSMMPGGDLLRAATRRSVPDVLPEGVEDAIAGDVLTREQAPVTDALRTAVEWGAAGIPGAGRRLATEGLRSAARYARGDLMAATGAGLGSAAGDTGGETAGGIAGTLLSLRRPRVTGGDKATDRAFRFIQSGVDNPAQLAYRTQRAVNEGRAGTLADIAEDRGLYNIEAAARRDVPDMFRQADEARNVEQFGAFEAPLGDAPAGQAGITARELAEAEQRRIRRAGREEQLGLEANYQAAEDAVEAAAAPLRTLERTDQAAGGLQGAIRRSAQQAKAASDEAWDAFKAGPPVETRPLRDAYRTYRNTLDPVEQKVVDKLWEDNFADISVSSGNREVTAGSFQDLIMRRAKNKNRQMYEAGDTAEAILLNRLIEAIDGGVDNAAYRRARALTTEEKTRFGPLRQALEAEPELAGSQLPIAGEGGALTTRRLREAGVEGGEEAVLRKLRADARAQGIDAAFIARHEATLDALPPEVADQFFQAAQQADALPNVLRQTQRAQQRAQAATDAAASAAAEAPVAQFGRDPTGTITRMMRSPSDVPDLRQLTRAMDEAGQGEAFRGEVRNWLQNKLFKDAADPQMAANSHSDFLKLRDNLVDSGIISDAQAGAMELVLSNANRSLTARQKAIADYMDRAGSEFDNLLASGLAAFTLAGMPGTQTLLVGGAVRRFFMRRLARKHIRTPEVKALEEMLVNPQKYLDAAVGARTAEEAMTRITTKFNAAAQTAAEEEDE